HARLPQTRQRGKVCEMIPDTKKKTAGSRLLILVGVAACILTIAVVAMPNLFRSRIAANEASAVGSVRSISTALDTYTKEHPGEGYPEELSDLTPYIDSTLATGQKSGYSFRYVPGGADFDGASKSYRVEATPVATQTGVRLFSTDE